MALYQLLNASKLNSKFLEKTLGVCLACEQTQGDLGGGEGIGRGMGEVRKESPPPPRPIPPEPVHRLVFVQLDCKSWSSL